MQISFPTSLEQYNKLFSKNDLKPAIFSYAYDYKALELEDLKLLFKELINCIKHQKAINIQKKELTKGAEYYLTKDGPEILADYQIKEIDYNYEYPKTQKDFGRLADKFIENTESTLIKISVLKDVLDKFIDISQDNLIKIYNLSDLNSLFAKNDVPEDIQYIDEHNLTQCIIDDLNSINENYIQNKLQKDINKCEEQLSRLKYIFDNMKDYDFKNKLVTRMQYSYNEMMKEYNEFNKNYTEIHDALTGMYDKNNIS